MSKADAVRQQLADLRRLHDVYMARGKRHIVAFLDRLIEEARIALDAADAEARRTKPRTD